jgi:3-oxoacyl-[acyl-carrier protein] reductase
MSNAGRLRSRSAIVTGAGQGIGQAIALRFAAEGASVLVTDVVDRRASETAAMVMQAGGEAVPMHLDVTNRTNVEVVVRSAQERFGTIDILVNNAGILRNSPFLTMSEELWDEVIAVHLKGAFHTTQCVLPGMIARKYGRIVNFCSGAALGSPNEANYSAAKAGLMGLTRTLALEFAEHNITVNAVAPGVIDTPMTHSIPEPILTDIGKQIPLGRFGTVGDIASAALFLASDEAAYVTGQILFVCGGRRVGVVA